MRKLLFHLNCFEQGGAERVVSNLVNQLVQEDYEVIAATEWQGEVEFALDPKVRRISVGLRTEDEEKSRITKIYLRFAYLHRLIREEKPDGVISFQGTCISDRYAYTGDPGSASGSEILL